MTRAISDLLRSAYPVGDTTPDMAMSRLCLRLKRRPSPEESEATAAPIDTAMPLMPSSWRGSTPMAGWP